MKRQQANESWGSKFRLANHPWISIAVVLVVFVLGLFGFSLLLTPEELSGNFENIQSAVTANAVLFAIYALVVFRVIPFGLGLPKGRKSIRGYLNDIRLSSFRPFLLLVALGLSVYLIFAASQLLGSLIYGQYVFDVGRILPPVSYSLLSAVNPGIFETIVLWGIILTLLLTRYSERSSILGAAAVFGGLHLFASPVDAVPAFVIGLLYGYLAVRTGSLLPGMIIHYLSNALLDLWVFLPSAPIAIQILNGVIFGLGLVPTSLAILWVKFVMDRRSAVPGQREV